MIFTGSLITGSGVVGVIVRTELPAKSNMIVSSPRAVLLAAMIALRSVPPPLLPVSLTVRVAACAEPAAPRAKIPAPSAPASVLLSMSSPSEG